VSDTRAAQPIWVFGECLVDDFGDAKRLGGAPFNVACHLWALGETARFISRVGRDAPAAEIRGLLRRWPGAAAWLQEDAQLPTGRVLVQRLGTGMHRFEILPHQAYDAIDADEELRVRALETSYLLYHGSLALREEGPSRATWRFLASRAWGRFVDINLRDGCWQRPWLAELLQGADTLKCNDEELGVLQREFGLGRGDAEAILPALAQRFGVAEIVLTCGPEGAMHWDGATLTRSHALSTSVVDTVGAGDAFSAGWLYARRLGATVAKALQVAHGLAARVCALEGALPEDPQSFYPAFVAELGVAAKGAVRA
jgi:fructokinase